MIKLGFKDFTLLVEGPIGFATLMVVVCVFAAGAWAYVHGFLHLSFWGIIICAALAKMNSKSPPRAFSANGAFHSGRTFMTAGVFRHGTSWFADRATRGIGMALSLTLTLGWWLTSRSAG